MNRRRFSSAIAALGVWSQFGLSQAQQALPIVGILSGTNRDPRLIDAVQEGLKEAGFTDGRNVAIEFRGAEGHFDRLPALAADLVQRRVSVIVAMQSANAPRAAKAAANAVPVVFCIGGDPVALGLVQSLSRPEGHVTGTTFLVNSLAGKRLELLREMLPSAATVGVLVNPKNPAAESELKDIHAAAAALRVKVAVRNAGSEREIDEAFAAFAQQRVNAVTFAADAVFNARRKQVIALAAQHRLVTMYFYRAFTDDGGLISYGGHDTDSYRMAGVYAGRILKGERPGNLPVQQSTKVELVINMKTAKAAGVQIPPSLIARADALID
ncbi:MAG TPA: ABC transporter substrate-binding protein [Burkholderiales bacterium]|nr:ABC transporter substrate-binding protein [Burkholderiales bacterium]